MDNEKKEALRTPATYTLKAALHPCVDSNVIAAGQLALDTLKWLELDTIKKDV